jgi:hypothetical protein
MSLDKQLREVLSEEGDSRTPPLPDLERLISGGRTRKRRRSMTRAATALAALAVIGGTAYGLVQADLRGSAGDPDTAGQPSVTEDTGRAPVEPGTHTYAAGLTIAGEPITFDVTLGGTGWVRSDLPVLVDGSHAAGTGAYRPERVASEGPCSDDWQGRSASQTLRGLARQLTRLPAGTVLEPPTPARVRGHDALHLSMRIGTPCPASDYYVVSHSEFVERGISYTVLHADVSIEFWVVDLDGTPVVVDLWHDVDAPQELVDQAGNARESITFLPFE